MLVATAIVVAFAVVVPLEDSVALHIVQHLALISVLAPAAVRLIPWLRNGTPLSPHHGLALVLGGVLLVYALHAPAVFEADLGALVARVPADLALVCAGVLLCLPMTGARCVRGLAAVLLLVVAELGVGALGIWLAWIPELVYELPDGRPPALGLTPRTDQALGGAFILVLAEPLLAVELVVLVLRALAED